MARWEAPALVAVMLLAGCASDPVTSADTEEAGDTVASADPTVPAGMSVARFPGEPVEWTVWANGTLKAESAAGVSAIGLGSPLAETLRAIEVGDKLPEDVPIILVGDIDAQMSQGNVQLWFDVPFTETRNGAWGSAGPGKVHIERGLVRTGDDPIALNVFYAGAEPAAEVPYALYAAIAFDPTIVRAAFPVGITVANGTRSMVVDLVGEARDFGFELDTPNLMLWGPDDAFLGHFALTSAQTTIALAEGAPAGEYVALLSQGGRSMRILTEGATPATLRAMPQEFVISEPAEGATSTKAEWTTTFDRVPVLAGVYFFPSTVSPDITVKLASPTATLVEGTTTGPFLNAPQAGFVNEFWWDSAYGVPDLVAGDYTASVTAASAVGADPIQASDIAAFWSR